MREKAGRVPASQRPAQRWWSLICLHLSCMLFSGLSKAYGVFLPSLSEQFAAEVWKIGWMFAIIGGIINFVGPLSGPLEFLLGPRLVVAVGGFMVGISIVTASFSTSVVVMTIILVIGGPGVSFSNILTRAIVARDFESTYATASSIGTAGHATGTLILAPLTQYLLDTYGWRGAMMLIGGISMHLGVCGCLLGSSTSREVRATTNGKYQPLGNQEDGGDDEEEEDEEATETVSESASSSSRADTARTSSSPTLRDALSEMRRRFGFSIFTRVAFWIGAHVYVSARFVTDLWLIYFVAQAQAKGFSAYEAVTFTTVAGAGSIGFKVASGLVVDRGTLRLRPTLSLLVGLGSVGLLVTPWMTSFWLMMANAVVCYGCFGAVGSLKDTFVRDTLGVDLLVPAFGWMEVIAALLNITFGFFPGATFDKSGSFDWAFVAMGCVWLLSLVSLAAEWTRTKRGKDSQA